MPEEVDTATILMLGMQEIKIGNVENGVLLLTKVSVANRTFAMHCTFLRSPLVHKMH